MNIAVIFAGGIGRRFKSADLPKQFVVVDEKPIIIHTLEIFEYHPEIDKIYISIHPDYKSYMKNLVETYDISKVCGITEGGATGQDSIYNGLILAASENPANSIVLIHDGVRPILSPDVISANIDTVKQRGNAITCTNCTETILISEDGISPGIVPFRKNTFSAQAPQSFILGEILEAHQKIQARPNRYDDMVDSCTIYNYLGRRTFLVRGNTGNIKVTNPEDLFILDALLKHKDFTANSHHIKKA